MTHLPSMPSSILTSRTPLASAITQDAAVTMLGLGLAGKHRPLDDLIQRLRRPDGATWLSRSLQLTEPSLAAPLAAILDGSATIAQLNAVKELSKHTIADAGKHEDQALGALALYCLSVAAALAHHGKLISSQPRTEWDDLMVDLADAAPDPWRSLLLKAAMAR